MRVKRLSVKSLATQMLEGSPKHLFSGCSDFSTSRAVKNMRVQHGKDALLVQCGSWIYNVTSAPEIYENWAH